MHKLGSGPLTSLEVRCRLFCSINLKKNDVENKSGSSRRNSEQEEAELQSGSKLPSPQAVYLMPGWGGSRYPPGTKKKPMFHLFQRERDREHRQAQNETPIVKSQMCLDSCWSPEAGQQNWAGPVTCTRVRVHPPPSSLSACVT